MKYLSIWITFTLVCFVFLSMTDVNGFLFFGKKKEIINRIRKSVEVSFMSNIFLLLIAIKILMQESSLTDTLNDIKSIVTYFKYITLYTSICLFANSILKTLINYKDLKLNKPSRLVALYYCKNIFEYFFSPILFFIVYILIVR